MACISQAPPLLQYLSTSYSMNFLALNNDVKFIISKHLASDLKIRALLSKNHDLQKIVFGDIMYNDDLCKYLHLQYNAKENDDFDTLGKCMSNFRIKSNSRVNWAHDKFYLMIRQSYMNCKIE